MAKPGQSLFRLGWKWTLILIMLLAGYLAWLRSEHLAREKRIKDSLRTLGAYVTLTRYVDDRLTMLTFDREEMREIQQVPPEAMRASKDTRRIGDDELVYLKELTTLESLNLGSTNVTDAGLVNLESLRNLQELGLRKTFVTGAGLKHLRKLESLRSLHIDDSVLDGEGLENVKKLTGLEVLHVRSTGFTKPKIDELRKKLPDCTILLGP